MLTLRYADQGMSMRDRFMRLCAKLQRKKVIFLKGNPELCVQLLRSSSSKGSFIENLIACPAWSPIFSLESIDGDVWQQLNKEFRIVIKELSWEQKIHALDAKYLTKFLRRLDENPSIIIDAESISKLTVNIFFELIFEKEMSLDEEELFYLASLEWRKELAVKGKASSVVKKKFLEHLRQLLVTSSFAESFARYRDNEDLYISVFAQPFFISPQINFSDIFAAMEDVFTHFPTIKEKVKVEAQARNYKYVLGVILECIRLKHPFPILERELSKDMLIEGKNYERGMQVFVMLDDFEQDQEMKPERWFDTAEKNPFKYLLFGAGPRVCLGQSLAETMLTEFLVSFLKVDHAKFRPKINHLYSGRDNDKKESFRSSLYQLKVFTGLIYQSYKIGKNTLILRKNP